MSPKKSNNARDVFIVDGKRTPFIKAKGKPGAFLASDLAVAAARPLLLQNSFDLAELDEVIVGCVMPTADEANIARVIALRLGIPQSVPAWTVQRNCASGMQALDCAFQNIQSGKADLILAGGTEAMSRAPILHNDQMVEWLSQFMSAKTFSQKLTSFTKLRPAHLKPIIALVRGLSDPIVGLSMGQTTEEIAYRFGISRVPQFTGILRKSSPNGAAWFISYILYLYIIFYAISNIRIRLYSKVILLFLLCYLTNKSIINVPMLNHFFGGWNTYTFVFPMSILVALNENHFSRLLKKCDEISPTLVFFILIIIIFIYLTAEMFRTGYLIMLISAAAFLVSSTRLKVNLLKWIGSYSYEIYLLHLPFLSSYSFLGEQLPQSLRIIIYITLLVILSIGLKRLSFTLIDFIFPYLAEK